MSDKDDKIAHPANHIGQIDVGDFISIQNSEGYCLDAEVVTISCPACGEGFTGSKRGAGGFIAGHQAYHEFVNAQDIMISKMGGV